ncbi:ABC transporter substrate-binding protein [Herbaspirillum huttiense F1]|jgi:amino acid/amide ABC transporter substrate-binding protein, HAAT family (TC 3.A.1.4.-)|uniref:ABC transporter substrate-binding protein n=1 Tax=Herbaspirillum huttiense subsp. lycopersici TaxID=3074428 RepID=A0ABU2EHF8_9BURK|nr:MULTISPECIES: ABC transporter substrate-binding protein [Herbaspirillum]MBP1313679.1 branched-chain amino acid transport system substrate-binding protein [Herbaspirillum sp. 1130]MCO4856278.1 ABC transporter substrate-binding protein [Herbaspirillum sp. WGmk3]MDR9847576.1 ABC transporter substrate-binding protein [Herbaspirillum huttiense SE1]MDT0355052.1 ABC transporter substrate-binding protein [Herbaspirillum huttiense F1]|tara:strand:- start:725 stop:2056 length:1332 start_codon:yes stop_codon:yes gene_type:complete
MKTMKHLRQWLLATACAASLLAPAAPVLAQASDQFIAIPSYRVGPYGTNGQSYYGGYVDYLNYINLKEGGVNGVKLSWEECETEYNNAKGVECYERMKNKNQVTRGTAINPMATGISYALIDKTAEDKVPLVMIGYGRTDAVDGSVFPYAFPLVTTYQMQVSAIVKYLAGKNNGSLAGKKIVFLYHDSAYGKEPIVALQAESSIGKFKLVEIPVAHPGNEQGAQWLRIRQENPDYVIFWGWGVMNQTALKAAQKVGYPRDKIVGSWWAGSEEDTIPAGDAAKGYLSATWNVAGKDVPVIADIDKVVYGAGKGNMQDKNKLGSILYNRGVSAAIATVEAVRTAQDKYGKGKVMSGEQVRWGFENLNITDARLKALGATGLLPEIKTSCDNHEGSGKVKIQQWDGTKWVLVSDWIEGNKNLIHPLFKASAAKYAKEKGITPACMK